MSYTYHARQGISTPVQILLVTASIILILGIIVVFAKQEVENIQEDPVVNDDLLVEDPLPTDGNGDTNIAKDPILESEQDIYLPEKELDLPSEKINWTGKVLAGNVSPLLDFNKKDYTLALASDKIVVMYFYANWCPTCKIEVSTSLYPAFNELERTDVVGFRVNFNDNQTEKFEKELASEFGIAYQHTKVFLRNGVRVLKSPESWTKDRYLDEINNFQH